MAGGVLRTIAVCTLIPWALSAGASPGPENVFVVVNSENEASVTIAREYVRLRRIPTLNVLYLKGVPASSTISVADFRARILTSVLDAIRSRGLSKQIDIIAFSAGFPYAVDVRADMEGRPFTRYITSPASITGLTYLYELVAAANPDYLEMQANHYFRGLKATRRDTAWTEQERRMAAALAQNSAQLSEALRAAPDAPETRRRLTDSVGLAEELAAHHPYNGGLLYDLACLRALAGNPAAAMRSLEKAVEAGWLNAAHAEADPDLASVRNRPDFRALLARMRSTQPQTLPPVPFRSSTRWAIGGAPSLTSGRRYFLCTMLAYVGGPANSLEEALASLRRAASADHTHPRGTIYFMVSSDQARTGPRRWAFEPAKAELAKLGVRAEVLDGVLPQSRADVAGAMVGAASFSWKSSGSSILPGAFCDHLTSFAGAMTGAGQTLLSEWIRYGAAGSSGTVTEPYALQAKFPTAFMHVFYASGCTLAEAFYQSVSSPYQQLLLGDPLCAPWAPRVKVSMANLRDGAVVKKPLRLQPHATGAQPVKRYELYVDGRLTMSCAPEGRLTLDPRNLTPGVHEARIVAVAGKLEWRGRSIVRFSVARPVGGSARKP